MQHSLQSSQAAAAADASTPRAMRVGRRDGDVYFMIRYSETPGLEATRARLRDEHIKYRRDFGAAMIMAGPLLSDDGETILGSVILVEAEGRDQATAIAMGDPLVPAGVLKVEDISAYRIAVIRPPAAK